MLTSVDHDLWVWDTSFALPKGLLPFGIPGFLGKCRLRMTVIRLQTGGLWIHSPTQPSPELLGQIKALGEVKFIVGPCVMHSTYLLEWKKLFPNAKLTVAPRTSIRNPSLTGFEELSDASPLAPEFKQKLMSGHKSQETIFLHTPTRTLIVTDLLYNIHRNSDLGEQLYYRLFKAFGRPAICSYHRGFLRDPNSFWNSISEISAWPFDRIIMSHGNIIETNGQAVFRETWGEFRKAHF